MNIKLLVKYRWFLGGLILFVNLLLIPYIQKAVIPNNALTVWFVEDDPHLKDYYSFQQHFGNDEVILILIDRKEEDVFDPNFLSDLSSLSDTLTNLDGVAQTLSIINMKMPMAKDGRLVYDTLLTSSKWEDESSLLQAKQSILSSDLLKGRIINATGSQTMLLVQMDVMADIDAKRNGIVAAVQALTDAYFGREHVFMGGIGVIFAALNTITQEDFGLFMGLCFLFIFILIGIIYRKLVFIGLALMTIISAGGITLGIYGLLGFQLNMITVILPTLIAILGIMDVMHIINEYYYQVTLQEGKDLPQAELVGITLKKVLKPCLFTTATTMAGFMALVSSPMGVLKEFGQFGALGIGLALLISIVYSAIVLMFIPQEEKAFFAYSKLQRAMEIFHYNLYTHLKKYAYLAIALIVILGIGYSKMVTDTDTIKYLPDDHRVVTDHQYIEKNWGYYFPLEFIVRPVAGKTMQDPELVKALGQFEEVLEKRAEVRNSFSVHSMYKGIFPKIYGPSWHKKLESPSAIKRFNYQAFKKDSASIGRYITRDFSLARVTLSGELVSAVALGDGIDEVIEAGQPLFEGIGEISATGYPPLFTKIVDYIMTSQKRGFTLALVMIWGLLYLMLRDFKLSLLAIIPNLFPVFLVLGIMGYAGITLNVATSTVATLIIGFSIDDTIHFIYHYKENKKVSYSMIDCIRHTFRHVGVVIVLTSLLIFVGYLQLIFASVNSVFFFGLLTSIGVLGALFAQLIIFPILLHTFDSIKKQD